MRTAFVRTLSAMMRRDDRIWVLTPDLGFSVLEPIRTEFPTRFLNTGIAEQNTVGVAAGLALSGKKVYVYSIIPFVTMRCFEQVRVDLAYMQTDVKLVGVGAGVTYGAAGATHHALEDIAIMRALPGMTVCCPGDPVEVEAIVEQSGSFSGPMYIRLGKNGEKQLNQQPLAVPLGKAHRLIDGTDGVIFVTSTMLQTAMETRAVLAARGRDLAVVSFPTVKPLDIDAVCSFADRGVPIITLEEHLLAGGFGSAVLEVLADRGISARVVRFGIPDRFVHEVASADELRRLFGLFPQRLADDIDRLC
jgi:transketolase